MPHDAKGPWMRLAAMGMELSAALVGFCLAGYAFDRHYDTAPWGLAVGGGLGLVGGMYNLIRASLRATRAATRPEDEQSD